jgi:hypothetical protein
MLYLNRQLILYVSCNTGFQIEGFLTYIKCVMGKMFLLLFGDFTTEMLLKINKNAPSVVKSVENDDKFKYIMFFKILFL